MRLVSLGGSAAAVGTMQGCSSYLVQSASTSLVLDLGPNTLLQLRRQIDYRTIDGIVLSHLHADHMLDLVALRFTLAYNPRKAERLVPLHVPRGGIEMLTRVAAAFGEGGEGIDWLEATFAISEFDPAGEVTVGDLACTFQPTIHFVPCWAIRVDEARGTNGLLYTADTGPGAPLERLGAGCAVVLAESAAVEVAPLPVEERGHLTPEEAAALAERIGARTLVLTHLFEEHDASAMIDRAAAVFPGTVIRSSPGLELSWRS